MPCSIPSPLKQWFSAFLTTQFSKTPSIRYYLWYFCFCGCFPTFILIETTSVDINQLQLICDSRKFKNLNAKKKEYRSYLCFILFLFFFISSVKLKHTALKSYDSFIGTGCSIRILVNHVESFPSALHFGSRLISGSIKDFVSFLRQKVNSRKHLFSAFYCSLSNDERT